MPGCQNSQPPASGPVFWLSPTQRSCSSHVATSFANSPNSSVWDSSFSTFGHGTKSCGSASSGGGTRGAMLPRQTWRCWKSNLRPASRSQQTNSRSSSPSTPKTRTPLTAAWLRSNACAVLIQKTAAAESLQSILRRLSDIQLHQVIAYTPQPASFHRDYETNCLRFAGRSVSPITITRCLLEISLYRSVIMR